MALLSPENNVMSAPETQLFSCSDPTICILGSRVHLVSATRTVDHIERWIQMRDGSCRQVIVTGFHGLLEAHKSPRIRSILNGAELWVPDGIAPVWLARMRGHRNVVDTEQTLAALCETAARKYPGHRIAGAYSPPFRPLTPPEESEIVERINAAQPDVLWVALGLPKQDIWIHERLPRLNVPVAIGVGAAFAFVAGTVPRCPGWMGNAGFEWVYRFFKEPRKLWRRDLFGGPRFLFLACTEFFKRREY